MEVESWSLVMSAERDARCRWQTWRWPGAKIEEVAGGGQRKLVGAALRLAERFSRGAIFPPLGFESAAFFSLVPTRELQGRRRRQWNKNEAFEHTMGTDNSRTPRTPTRPCEPSRLQYLFHQQCHRGHLGMLAGPEDRFFMLDLPGPVFYPACVCIRYF